MKGKIREDDDGAARSGAWVSSSHNFDPNELKLETRKEKVFGRRLSSEMTD